MSVFESGQCAVITCAALGIGRATAKRLSEMGVNVRLVDLPGEDLSSAARNVEQTRANDSGNMIARLQDGDVC